MKVFFFNISAEVSTAFDDFLKLVFLFLFSILCMLVCYTCRGHVIKDFLCRGHVIRDFFHTTEVMAWHRGHHQYQFGNNLFNKWSLIDAARLIESHLLICEREIKHLYWHYLSLNQITLNRFLSVWLWCRSLKARLFLTRINYLCC